MRIFEGKTVYTVTEINSYTRSELEKLSFWVEGETASFKGLNSSYRYLYFDLKDTQTEYKLPCILEPDIYRNLDFKIENGQKILALGNLTLWEKEARLQMYVLKIEEFGEGVLLAQMEKLKEKLEKKGYFEQKNKKELPSFPTNIAVITSDISDAWHDFKRHSTDSFPIIKIKLYNVVVQGTRAVAQISKALKLADKKNFDAVILIRGGGSQEDLQAYNDEGLAGVIYNAKTPIIVGVGHEKDITIASLVADIQASTPTDAAKIITRDFINLEERLGDLVARAQKNFIVSLSSHSQFCDLTYHKLITHKDRYQQMPKHLDFLYQALKNCQKSLLLENKQQLTLLYWKLNLLSPKNTLKRGYSIAYDENGKIVQSIQSIEVGANVKVQLFKGSFLSKVLEKEG